MGSARFILPKTHFPWKNTYQECRGIWSDAQLPIKPKTTTLHGNGDNYIFFSNTIILFYLIHLSSCTFIAIKCVQNVMSLKEDNNSVYIVRYQNYIINFVVPFSRSVFFRILSGRNDIIFGVMKSWVKCWILTTLLWPTYLLEKRVARW